MKKFTLFLMTMILTMVGTVSSFAQTEYKIDPSKEITTPADQLEGVVCIPTDATGEHVWTLKGGNDWDVGSLPLANWASKAEHNYIKFVKPSGDYSACGVEGDIYALIFINEAGANFSQWGNPGAFNMQPGDAPVMFALGYGNNFGQDGDYLALWKVVYEEGNGYVLQNVGRMFAKGEKQYATPASANPVAEKVYVKLYSALVEDESISDGKIEAVMNKLNGIPSALELDLSAVEAAKAKVEASRTQEDLDALEEAVKAALAINDRTSLIVNPEISGADGWTIERPVGGNGPLLGGVSFEYWAGNASNRQEAGFNYYQTIEVPNGKYILTAEMYNSSNGEEGTDHAPNGNAGLYANDSFVGCTVDAASFGTVYETEVVNVTDGKLTIGVKSIGYMSARWFAADNFKLWYAGEIEESEAPVIAIEEGEGTYTVTSTSADAALYYLCKPMSWLDEDETPESVLQNEIEGMGSMIDSEETWELYDHMGMKPAPKTFTVADYEEMYAGQEMFIIAANVGWDGEKLAAISNIEVKNFTVPAPEPKPELAEGDYVIKNVAEGRYLNGANSWGTKASTTLHGQFMTLAKLEDGTYTIDSHHSNGGDKHYLAAGDNTFIDALPVGHTIEAVAEGIFTIKDSNGKYLAANEGLVNFNADEVTEAAQWQFITKEDILAQETPADFTALIKDANFNRNNTEQSAWDIVPSLGGPNYSKGENITAAGLVAEKWGGNSQEFTSAQTIELPNGKYILKVQGFYRYNNTTDNTNDVAAAAHADGTEEINSFFFANDQEVALMSIADETAVAEYGKMPFSQAEAASAFVLGLYQNEIEVEVTDGTLTLGVKKTSHPGTDWTVWDNFELTYLGPVEPLELATVAIAEEEGVYTITSDKDYVLVQLCKPMSWLDEGETVEDAINAEIEGMASTIDSAEAWEGMAGFMDKAPKTIDPANYQEMYAGEEMFIVAANIAWNEKEGKVTIASNIAQTTFTVPAPAPEIAIADMQLNVAEDEQIAEDGNFKVEFTFAATANEAAAATFPQGMIAYQVTDAEENVVDEGETDFDIDLTSRNIYAKNLEAGKTYTLTVTKVYGAGFDMETFESVEIPATFEGELPSVTFTVAEPELADCDLTKEMFKVWTAFDETAEATEQAPGYEEHWGESMDAGATFYGNGSVIGAQFADLTGYTALSIKATEGTPRLLFNRQSMDGNSPDFLQIQEGEGDYVTKVGDYFVYNLAKIAEDKTYVHLNVIKAAWGSAATLSEATLHAEATFEDVLAELEATSINGISTAAKAKANGKYLENGKVVIVRNGVKYNIGGSVIK